MAIRSVHWNRTQATACIGLSDTAAFDTITAERNRFRRHSRGLTNPTPVPIAWSRFPPCGRIRNGPYGEGHTFASYGAFAGNNCRKNAANPARVWRNKTQFGFGGSFLSDPAWTFSRAVDGFAFSPDYLLNPYADWKVTVHSASAGKKISSLRLWQDGWQLSSPDWWILHEDGEINVFSRYCLFSNEKNLFVNANDPILKWDRPGKPRKQGIFLQQKTPTLYQSWRLWVVWNH